MLPVGGEIIGFALSGFLVGVFLGVAYLLASSRVGG